MAFNDGEVVQLKSGGPLMTVKFSDGRSVICQWFNNVKGIQKLEEATFPENSLAVVPDNDEAGGFVARF